MSKHRLFRMVAIWAAVMLSAAGRAHTGFVEDTTIVYTSCDSIQLAATLALPDGGHAILLWC